jgi:ubiquinone/menaquinone biosynthesis C-methylase UbiE
MQVEKIYNKRFGNTAKRTRVWKVLVKYFFLKYFKENDTVLDIGGGYCEFINSIKCKKKYVLDINPDIKKYANRDVTVLLAKSTKIPLKKETVDKIFISNFFEHITREDIIKTIIEMKRVLRKDGEIVTMHPNIRFLQKDFWRFFDHITPIDDRALEEIFAIYDFLLEKKILKFLPYTMSGERSTPLVLLKIYLHFPILWKIFGKQSLLVFKKR